MMRCDRGTRSLLGALALALIVQAPASAGKRLSLPGLEKPVKVLTDELGVPHVYAKRDHDVFFVQGYLHARDRFFQMDANRRSASGTLAELTGSFADLTADARARAIGFRLGAQRSFDLLEPGALAVAQAYADGVNAWLATGALPAEYADLEVTQASVPPWTVLDTLTMAKAGVPPVDVRSYEIGDTDKLQSYVDALGAAAGVALYHEDVGRFAPMTPRATLPDALGVFPLAVAKPRVGLEARAPTHGHALARRFAARAAPVPGLARALRRPEAGLGSNIWGVAAAHSASGRPILAADGHSPLTAPGEQYEIHLVVAKDPVAGPLNVSGVGNPGIPGVSSGQNPRVAWSWTSLYHDVSDVFEDRLVRGDPSCAASLCIESAGAMHPVERRTETYRLNQIGDGVADNSTDVTALVASLAPEAVDVLSVPFRSFGPILALEDPTVVEGRPWRRASSRSSTAGSRGRARPPAC